MTCVSHVDARDDCNARVYARVACGRSQQPTFRAVKSVASITIGIVMYRYVVSHTYSVASITIGIVDKVPSSFTNILSCIVSQYNTRERHVT